MANSKPKSARAFDYDLDYGKLDFRERPELYRVGKGEQGVLLVEPYKSELLPLWRFKTPEIAKQSGEALEKAFRVYQKAEDFVGMDMARKFIQMGFTRARRYANHRSGKKYGAKGEVLERDVDPVKAESAAIFYALWKQIENDIDYAARKTAHKNRYG